MSCPEKSFKKSNSTVTISTMSEEKGSFNPKKEEPKKDESKKKIEVVKEEPAADSNFELKERFAQLLNSSKDKQSRKS